MKPFINFSYKSGKLWIDLFYKFVKNKWNFTEVLSFSKKFVASVKKVQLFLIASA